jgi:AraC-like DNA-binding protein
MHTNHERLVNWLLGNVELKSSIFHIGQYCGAWRASTSGRGKAGFHLVMNGECWLHLPEKNACIPLGRGDGVFFLRDVPHYLSFSESPERSASIPLGSVQMTSIDLTVADGVALACGFFDFHSDLGKALVSTLPDYVAISSESSAAKGIKSIFELIISESASSQEAASPLVARLVDILFYYVIRHLSEKEEIASGIWAVLAQPEFSRLMDALINEPGREWTVEEMASLSNMSRATFFKRFFKAAGQSPAHFLTIIRMRIASHLLGQGQTITRAAEQVGYQSEAAFSRAFKKVTGELPGSYRRMHSVSHARSILP